MLIRLSQMTAERAKEIQAAFIEAVGTAYDPKWPLPNLKPSSDIEFWANRSSHLFDAEAWTSAQRIDGRWSHVLLYFYRGGHFGKGGFSVVYTYEHGHQKVTYYRWSQCAHEFRQKNIGNCLNRYTCIKCQHAYDVDSSD